MVLRMEEIFHHIFFRKTVKIEVICLRKTDWEKLFVVQSTLLVNFDFFPPCKPYVAPYMVLFMETMFPYKNNFNWACVITTNTEFCCLILGFICNFKYRLVSLEHTFGQKLCEKWKKNFFVFSRKLFYFGTIFGHIMERVEKQNSALNRQF